MKQIIGEILLDCITPYGFYDMYNSFKVKTLSPFAHVLIKLYFLKKK